MRRLLSWFFYNRIALPVPYMKSLLWPTWYLDSPINLFKQRVFCAPQFNCYFYLQFCLYQKKFNKFFSILRAIKTLFFLKYPEHFSKSCYWLLFSFVSWAIFYYRCGFAYSDCILMKCNFEMTNFWKIIKNNKYWLLWIV